MIIYHWKLGDVAMARLSKRVYAKVQVVKDEKGLFYDDMVLGITADGDDIAVTEELCYYVEIIRNKEKLWLPYTCLHLAERSRPFYGPSTVSTPPQIKSQKQNAPRKRKIIDDHTLPLNVKLSKSKQPDLNTSLEIRQMPLKQGRDNAYKEFVRRGKEKIFDECLQLLEADGDKNVLDYLYNVDASTEDKFEMVIKNVMTEKEVENYLRQCWRYNFVQKQIDIRDSNDSKKTETQLPITVHTSWCLVCGKGERLRECPNCPSCFHPVCRREWLTTIIHRKNPPKKTQKPVTLVEKILSSTRTICNVHKEKENMELCPSCMWGPRVGYDDIVWHKLGSCPWWPARVLPPGAAPSCLLARAHTPHQWPLRYYGTLNHSWGDLSRMSLLLPAHVAAPGPARDPDVSQALLDACDDYIAVTLNHSWGDLSRMSLLLPAHVAAPGPARDPDVSQALLDACDDYIAVYLT